MAGIWKKLKREKENTWEVHPFARIGDITEGNVEIGFIEQSNAGIVAHIYNSGDYLLTWEELYADLKKKVVVVDA